MNKVIVILAVIVLITLSGLFFCAGFFSATRSNQTADGIGATVANAAAQLPSADKIAATAAGTATGSSDKAKTDMDSVKALINSSNSSSLSDKIVDMLSSAAKSASNSIKNVGESVGDAIDIQHEQYDNAKKLTVSSLLREMAMAHSEDDSCSPEKTENMISEYKPISNEANTKRLVFIGYFKNHISLQVQKLLMVKGYRAHIEMSKSNDGESFIFCGPFNKDSTAAKLVDWLNQHGFSEARVLGFSNEKIEEKIIDLASDHESVNIPLNAENPEMAAMITKKSATVDPKNQEKAVI